MYVSNENATLVDVYFDDVVMTYTKSNIVQYNEYYPFGLQTQNSWTRENVTGNNFLYNGGSELNTTTAVYDLFFRNYDPALGRMNQVDPMAAKYASLTPYNYALNDPVRLNDPLGDDVEPQKEYREYYCGSCWRSGESAMLYMLASGYGGSMYGNGMGAGWRPGWSGVAPGSGNHWADGIGLSDWSSYGGSQMFRDGLAAGLTAIGSQLYGYAGGKLTRMQEANGRIGFWEKYTWIDYTEENASVGGEQLATIGIGLRFKALGSPSGPKSFVIGRPASERLQVQTQGSGPGLMMAGVGYEDAANIAAYMVGTSETFNDLYYMNKVRNTLVNDPRFKLSKAFPGNFKGYSRNVTNVFNEYRVMTAAGKALGKTMFGVGLALTAYDIYENKGSTSSIVWGIADTGVAATALLLASNPVGWVVGAGAALYFTGRFAYSVYEAYNEGK
jgi:RHS repeat-associated protein